MTKVDTLKVGDVLHDVHRHKAGNTSMMVEGHWKAIVTEVGVDEHGVPYADISWNSNRPRRHYRTVNYKRFPKEWIRSRTIGGRTCGMCHNNESQGHKDTCEHPKAVSARKKAAKAK